MKQHFPASNAVTCVEYMVAHATPLLQKSGWPIRMRGLSRSSPPSTSTGRGGSSPASPGEQWAHCSMKSGLNIGNIPSNIGNIPCKFLKIKSQVHVQPWTRLQGPSWGSCGKLHWQKVSLHRKGNHWSLINKDTMLILHSYFCLCVGWDERYNTMLIYHVNNPCYLF